MTTPTPGSAGASNSGRGKPSDTPPPNSAPPSGGPFPAPEGSRTPQSSGNERSSNPAPAAQPGPQPPGHQRSASQPPGHRQSPRQQPGSHPGRGGQQPQPRPQQSASRAPGSTAQPGPGRSGGAAGTAASPWGASGPNNAASAQKPPQVSQGAVGNDGPSKAQDPAGKAARAKKNLEPGGTKPDEQLRKVSDAYRDGGLDAGAGEAAGQGGRFAAEKGLQALTGGASATIPGADKAAGKVGEVAGKAGYKVTKVAVVAGSTAFAMLMFFIFGAGGSASLLGSSGADYHAPRPTKEQCEAMPENWCDVVYDAQRATERSRISVPWTLLAGLANAQTDFGRTSPYDVVDRYPNRPVPPYLAENPGGMAVIGETYTGPLGSIAGLNPEQMRNAKTIIDTARSLGVPEYGQVISVATALQESSLINLNGGDRDSVGLFQQRPSMDWGTVAQSTDPVYATTAFLTGAGTNKGLLDIAGWQGMAVTVAAQAVQRSGFPSAYAKHEPVARALVKKFGGAPEAQVAPDIDVSGPRGESNPAVSDPGADAYVEKGGDGCEVAPPTTPIGGKRGQAAGPFLVNAAVAEELGDSAQNPCDAATYVARRLAEAAQDIYSEGEFPLSPTQAGKAPAFWRQVIVRADVMADPAMAGNVDCSVPTATATTPVGELIEQIWSCELNRAKKLEVVASASVAEDGRVTFDTYDRVSGTDVLIAEAKTASWHFSRWKKGRCDTDAAHAGIFPLTQTQATAHGAADRCNVQANIRTAAQLVAEGESVPVAQRPAPAGETFAPMLGGWDNIRPVLGKERGTFTLTGPVRTWAPSTRCTQVATRYLKQLAAQPAPFADLAETGAVPADTRAMVRAVAGAGDAPGDTSACAAPTDAVMSDTLSRIADQLAAKAGHVPAVEHEEDEHTDEAPVLDSVEEEREPVNVGYDPAAMRGLEVWFAEQARDVPAVERAVYGQHPVIDRLSAVTRSILPAPVDDSVRVKAAPWHAAATDWGIFYGGLVYRWDTFGKRTGSLLANAGQTAGTASSWGSASQQAQIVIDAAKQWLGTPYSYGGGGPKGPSVGPGTGVKGFDCSGLTEYAFAKAGYQIGTYTGVQIKAGTRVRGGLATALPGDLLFFPGHVAIYLGDNMLIHAPRTGDVVKIEKVYATPTAIRRVLKDSALSSGVVGTVGQVTFPLPSNSAFTDNRNWGNGGTLWGAGHTGNDFSVACGTPVFAATAGTVQIRTDQSWSGPWLVMVSTGPGRLTTWYAHMEKIYVRSGQKVAAGHRIGDVGTLGNSTGCHLHFEYHPRGGSIYEDNTDPVPWLQNAGAYPRRS